MQLTNNMIKLIRTQKCCLPSPSSQTLMIATHCDYCNISAIPNLQPITQTLSLATRFHPHNIILPIQEK